MANRDLLADAIADAKAVKEVAIANAKAALEEAFTPHLKDMLAQKINEMEDLEETELAEVDKEKKMEEEMKDKVKEEKDDSMEEEMKKDSMEEELDLEEILAELELEEEELQEKGGNIDPGAEPKSFLKKKPEYVQLEEDDSMEEEMKKDDSMEETYGKKEMEEEMKKDSMEEEYGKKMDEEMDDDAEINLEDMSEDELKTMIEDVIEDMIEDGELVPGPNADESEEEEMEDTDDGMEGDADVDIEVDDIDLQEGKEEKMEEAMMMSMNDLVKAFNMLGMGAKKAFMKAIEFQVPGITPGFGMEEGEKEAMEETIQTLRSDLNEVNLLNSKLLYTNKIFRGKNLTENQKIKVLKAFDKAETVKEAKRVFETLNENLVAKTTKSNIRESLGAASKPAGVAPKRPITENVVQEDAMVNRFKQLAGIK